MPAQGGNGGQGGAWGGDGIPPDIEDLFRHGRDRLKRMLPGGGPRGIAFLAILIVAGLGVRTAYYTVPSDSVAVVQRFGKYLKEVPPGLHFKIPLGVDAAAEKVRVFGIELLDIRFKRINYNESVRPKIYDRMISERRQIAERFLSEGNGEAARIRGNRVRDLNKVQSEAYRQVEEIRGIADAKATEIYASAYNLSPEAVSFYEFTRTMQSYKSMITENTTLVLSTDSDLFKFLKGMSPADKVPPGRSLDANR